jgi:hypothetical protein
MKIITAASLDHGRLEGASDGPASISMTKGQEERG